jgi:hypothetical protein
MSGIHPSPSVNVTLGVMNAGWGVCGFTSTFHAMHLANPGTRAWLINATQAYSVLYEIRDYLVSVKGTTLEADITKFTQSFGVPHDKFNFDWYINKIDTASANLKEGPDIMKDSEFGIAMPPHAVKDYVERAWKWQASVTEFTTPGDATRSIVGVTPDFSNGKPYHGLCHYLFRGDNKFYSWGKVFGSLTDAMGSVGLPNAKICYAIKVSRP